MSNFSNTVIYKIVCLDPTITDVYVGSTTDFYSRSRNHKSNCYNQNKESYNYKIYTTIRANGGWENWKMIQIEDCPCDNYGHQLERERYWYDILKPSLNIQSPLQTKEENKKYQSEYYKTEKYKEYRREYYKDYYVKKKEKIIQDGKDYYIKNKEKINKKNKEYYEKNKGSLIV